MKELIFAFILLFQYINLIAQEDTKLYELSSRVGNEIDSYEKSYFGLFKGLDSISEAKIYRENEDRFKVIINFPKNLQKKDTLFYYDKKLVSLIKYYIENFENMYKLSGDPLLKDSVLWKNVLPRVRYFQNSITYTDFNNNDFTNQFLYYDSTYIVLWKNENGYKWDSLENNIQIVFFNQIKYLDGYYIDGAFKYFNEACSEIYSKQSFLDYYNDNTYIPRELIVFAEKIENRIMPKSVLDSILLLKPQSTLRKKNYLIIGYNWDFHYLSTNSTASLNTYSNIYGLERKEIFQIISPKISHTISIETNLYFDPVYAYFHKQFTVNEPDNRGDIFWNIESLSFGMIYKFDNIINSKKIIPEYFNNFKLLFDISVGVVFRTIEVSDAIRKPKINTDYKGYPYLFNNKVNDACINFGLSSGFSIIQNLMIKFQFQYLIAISSNLDLLKTIKWENGITTKKYWQTVSENEIELYNYKLSIGLHYALDAMFTYL